MAMAKVSKAKSIPHRHIHARLSYLHQASSYLSMTRQSQKLDPNEDAEGIKASSGETGANQESNYGQSRHLLSQLRAVSLKSQIRLSSEVKHTLCKRCNSLLAAGKTSTQRIVNESNGGRKVQADVVVVECMFCGTPKRFAVGQSRRPKNVVVDHGKNDQSKDPSKQHIAR